MPIERAAFVQRVFHLTISSRVSLLFDLSAQGFFKIVIMNNLSICLHPSFLLRFFGVSVFAGLLFCAKPVYAENEQLKNSCKPTTALPAIRSINANTVRSFMR